MGGTELLRDLKGLRQSSSTMLVLESLPLSMKKRGRGGWRGKLWLEPVWDEMTATCSEEEEAVERDRTDQRLSLYFTGKDLH